MRESELVYDLYINLQAYMGGCIPENSPRETVYSLTRHMSYLRNIVNMVCKFKQSGLLLPESKYFLEPTPEAVSLYQCSSGSCGERAATKSVPFRFGHFKRKMAARMGRKDKASNDKERI